MLGDVGELAGEAAAERGRSDGRAWAGHSRGAERADALGQVAGQAAQQLAARGEERLQARALRYVPSLGVQLVAALAAAEFDERVFTDHATRVHTTVRASARPEPTIEDACHPRG